ncbi:D-alanyl-D-alanine dipeptidase [Dysgonomonas sp. 216]|nr:D-alanyl-D-alanine dipeptidase [Dysgonomonas sp. 216]NDW18700.1 D-alanyl-D-alanine dipeptidase [Dysgonomonas sp. 216]
MSVCTLSCSSTSQEGKKLVSGINPELIKFNYSQVSSTEKYLRSLGLVDIAKHDSSIVIDLKYATSDNFTGVILYIEIGNAYLHPLAMEKLCKASQILNNENSELRLLIYDAARPLSAQKRMFEVVQGTKYQAYVANPSRTGLHNYGMAVDLTICDENRVPLDMGTPFDYFGKTAGINDEDLFVSQGLLTREQVNNRRLLRRVMQESGFIAIRGEWWHFNACSLSEAQRIAKLIE